MIPITEEVVRGTARICGPHSAAAQAVQEAERRRATGEEVAFFRVDRSIIVASRAAGAAPEGKGE